MKQTKKLLAWMLMLAIICVAVPVQAEDINSETIGEETEVENLQNNNDNLEVSEIEQRLNYVYVESPYLETPDTQRIVVSWGEENEDITQIILRMQNANGEVEEWYSTNVVDNLYLYEKEFMTEEESGTYQVTSIKVINENSEVEFTNDQMGLQILFGVNVEYDGYDKLQPIESEDVEVSVVKIDEYGVVETETSIEDALAEVSQDMQTQTFSSKERSLSNISNDVVIALDPGHDSTHSGANNISLGLYEEVLVLKIANYCKAELETYPGVTVYMTRTTAACPYPGGTSGEDIRQRTAAAAKAGAKIFVSFHLNSSISTSAKGAEVIVPNNNWKPEIGAAGSALGQSILDELVKLGLKDRGIYSKSTDDSTYEDGSKSDYFAVQAGAKQNGMPGIIIEHAFVSNADDAGNYLTTEAGLKKLGVADAQGIVNYLGLSKTGNNNGWMIDQYGNQYYYQNGKAVVGEKNIQGNWYYFDENTGIMITGWHDFPNKKVYYKPTGEMVHGEYNIENEWYYFSEYDGAMTTGWHQFPEKLVYYKSTGEMVHGEYNIENEWYHFSEYDGAMTTSWYDFPNKKVYYKPTGEMVHGEYNIENEWYHFSEYDGAMTTGWHQFPEKLVYYKPTGEMVHGPYKIENEWYYFDTYDGAMKTNYWYNNCYFGANGKLEIGSLDDETQEMYTIAGDTTVTIEQMVKLYQTYATSTYQTEVLGAGGASTIEELARIFYEEACAEGIKAEVAWAQSMLETGYLKFGGQVKVEQFNFGGLGALDGGASGADFSSYGVDGVRMGVRAQIQHLKAYASTQPLNNECVDPRFSLVNPRGCAEYVEYLGQKENPTGKGWATSEQYGYKILNIIKILKNM